MGKYAYTNTDTNICRLTGFSLTFISFWLAIIKYQLDKWPISKLLKLGSIGLVILVNVYVKCTCE